MRPLLTLLLLSLPPLSAQAADPVAGREAAAQWCAACHRVAAEGPGPASDATPGFAAIARRPEVTAAGLSTFLRTPHAGMPDPRVTLRQAEDIAAYILSLRP
jgi:mono/diheme cytochrome c family protein